VILYADTSALVKAVLLEVGTDRVGAWFGEAEQVASSVITYAEACAALGRRDRLRDPDRAALKAQLARLDAQWNEFLVVPVDERLAGRAALEHGLRGMDAVQLSAAMRLRVSVTQYAPDAEVAFAAFDGRLLEAAEREGFATLGRPLA
jgi:predicted nucleic acid-binding protein